MQATLQGLQGNVVGIYALAWAETLVILTSALRGVSGPELFSLALVRLFSSSAATGVALDIFKEYGTDSLTGLAASIMMSCTETVFYTMSVYFAAAKITKTRYTVRGALLATAAGIAASVVLAAGMI